MLRVYRLTRQSEGGTFRQMPRVRPIIKIRCAAYHFARISRSLDDLASAFDVSPSTIRNWEQTPEWHETLDVIGYVGDCSFAAEPNRDTAREKPEAFEAVRAAYIKLFRDGEVPARIPRLVEKETGVPRRTVSDWATRYNLRMEAWNNTKGD